MERLLKAFGLGRETRRHSLSHKKCGRCFWPIHSIGSEIHWHLPGQAIFGVTQVLTHTHMAMGHRQWRSRFGVDEHPFAIYSDVGCAM